MNAAEPNNAVPAPTEPLQDLSNANATNVAPTSAKRGRGRPRGSFKVKSSGPKRRSGRLQKAASDASDDEWAPYSSAKAKLARLSGANDTDHVKRRPGRPRKSEGPVGSAGVKINQPTSGPRVLFKLRFAAYADKPEESKNVSVAISASTVVVFDGIRDALDRADKEPSEWSLLSVKCFDEAFGELVEVLGDDGLENLRKYEVQLQRKDVEEEQEENREEEELDEKDGDQDDE